MRRDFLWALAAVVAIAPPAAAQDASLQAGLRVARLVAEPTEVSFEAGSSAALVIRAVDASGATVDAEVRVFGRGVNYDGGRVSSDVGGTATLIASVVLPADATQQPATLTVPITVTWPAVARIELDALSSHRLYAGTSVRYGAEAYFGNGNQHASPSFSWSSSNASVATVNARGNVTARSPGSVTISASFDGVRGSATIDVPALPASSLEITGGADQARQGDVLTFQAVLTGSRGVVADAPIAWTVAFQPDDSINAPGAAGLIDGGKFVGEVPGLYTVIATAGDLLARTTVDVAPREAVQEVQVQGQGSVSDVHTSDLWIYEGNDGRDYAVTGTWGANGWAYFWDVTNPAAIVKTDSIHVDARTVNDVKVAPNARYAAISREGASNRRNGAVILDLADPAHPVIASTFDTNGVTGGVHNMFATDDYLFALAGGDKYVIIDVTDLANPRYVSEYNHPDSRIHDVWVHDGVAYSSEWANGVVVVDVGNGRWGGSIDNPVYVTNVPYPVGATHAAFPYYQEDTGKFYLFLGDEIMNREGEAWGGAGLGSIPEQGGTPSVTRGYIHIIDFTDPEHPVDVARYQAAEFGTHNLWVEDDMLYVAYYEGGVRTVDVSGELMGNLATQGREVAVYKAFDPNGYAANAPMAWGPQPYKGNLFFSDFNSGLWSVKVMPKGRPIS
ncbi:MAG: Ig-like domain-containing protein [Gemmatimonadetes bacterium]|nr:Ig-like domain-containing protein [Gemmatimonadota bacterium]